jgi:hypothetical protein
LIADTAFCERNPHRSASHRAYHIEHFHQTDAVVRAAANIKRLAGKSNLVPLGELESPDHIVYIEYVAYLLAGSKDGDWLVLDGANQEMR